MADQQRGTRDSRHHSAHIRSASLASPALRPLSADSCLRLLTLLRRQSQTDDFKTGLVWHISHFGIRICFGLVAPKRPAASKRSEDGSEGGFRVSDFGFAAWPRCVHSWFQRRPLTAPLMRICADNGAKKIFDPQPSRPRLAHEGRRLCRGGGASRSAFELSRVLRLVPHPHTAAVRSFCSS